MLRSLSDPILSIIYPRECRVCGGEVDASEDGIACRGCWEETKLFSDNETLCYKCGAFLFEGPRTDRAFCRKCDEQHYDRAFSLGHYEKALSATVLHLKRVPVVSSRLKRLFADLLRRSSIPEHAIVIPVPLSARRLRERGFNQASVIANTISKHLGSALDETSLHRKIHTPMHRAGMDRKARASTVKNAFDVARPKLIENKDVLLVDDIFTSGATASSCADVLKQNGASSVSVMTIARAA